MTGRTKSSSRFLLSDYALCRFHQIRCQHVHEQPACEVACVDGDLIIAQLQHFLEAQLATVCGKPPVLRRQLLGKLLLPAFQECAYRANITLLAVKGGANLPYCTARLCFYGIIGDIRLGGFTQKQQIAFLRSIRSQ